MENDVDFSFDTWCDPPEALVPLDVDETLAQRARQDACFAQAQRQAEDELFMRTLNAPGFCCLANARTFMVISQHVAITRMAALIAFLAVLREIVCGFWLVLLVQRALLLAAHHVVPAATPSGRAIPTYCLSPRLLGQRPQTARAARAALMR